MGFKPNVLTSPVVINVDTAKWCRHHSKLLNSPRSAKMKCAGHSHCASDDLGPRRATRCGQDGPEAINEHRHLRCLNRQSTSPKWLRNDCNRIRTDRHSVWWVFHTIHFWRVLYSSFRVPSNKNHFQSTVKIKTTKLTTLTKTLAQIDDYRLISQWIKNTNWKSPWTKWNHSTTECNRCSWCAAISLSMTDRKPGAFWKRAEL